ncbi:MAG: TIR domain-containing protein [Chloroflexi bacterium]|nr:MAG: TIR domain-containing protein [Chloroflexota bacterium]
MTYETASLRKFIIEFFSAQELSELLFDYFRDVHNDITPRMPKSDQIQMLLEYAVHHEKMEHLLSAIAQEKPGKYRRDLFIQDYENKTSPTVTTIQRNLNQIFISHAHQDAEFAHKLADDLKVRGFDIWIAPDSIQPGEKWVAAISRGLDESGIFIVVLTPDAVNSRWVKGETDVAIEMEANGEIVFLPLHLKSCRPPAMWRSYQRIPFYTDFDAGFSQLLASLDPEKQSQPSAPKPEPPAPKTQPALIELAEHRSPRIELPLDRIIWPKDGKEMVLVPAGEFYFGRNNEKEFLESFWIDRWPVTNEEYEKFITSKGYSPPDHWRGQPRNVLRKIANHPVVMISWYDAQSYAEWSGKLLPSQKHWEKAARGTDSRQYPWGNDMPTEKNCNYARHMGGTTIIGAYSPYGDSPYGCFDMSGNVWEWTSNKGENAWERVTKGGSCFSLRIEIRECFEFNSKRVSAQVGFRLMSPV